MAGRGRSSLSRPRAPRSAPGRPEPGSGAAPLVYTAQDVARFCEVDLKTIHHWADAGKIPHHRTKGRHLRFRRNHVLQFLRAHGYPLHDEITSARPTVFLAAPRQDPLGADELARRLSDTFFVRRFEHAVTAIAHLVDGAPDAIVCSLEDPTWGGPSTIAALKRDVETSWPFLVVVVADESAGAAGADLAIPWAEIGRLHAELVKTLGSR